MASNRAHACGYVDVISAFLAVALLATPIQADEVVRKDGTRVAGRILSSSADSVVVDAPQGAIRIAHADVDTFRFAVSDVIQPQEGVPVRGKILRKAEETVFIATTDGVVPWSNRSIKKVWYGRGPAIELTQFGETGTVYTSRKVTVGVPMVTHERIYSVGLRSGLHIGLMDDWRRQFVDENGNHPVASFLPFGADGYADISRTLFIGGGVEYLWGRKITIEGVGDDRASAWLLFGSLGFLTPMSNYPEYEIGGAVDVGYLWGKEHAGVDGAGADGTAQTFAIRPKALFSYAASPRVAMRAELGWLVANAKDLEFGGETLTGYDLDFSGLSMMFGVAFVGPL